MSDLNLVAKPSELYMLTEKNYALNAGVFVSTQAAGGTLPQASVSRTWLSFDRRSWLYPRTCTILHTDLQANAMTAEQFGRSIDITDVQASNDNWQVNNSALLCRQCSDGNRLTIP